MDRAQMTRRTKQLALRVLNLVDALPRTTKGRCFTDQLTRCGTSVGANYRASGRARGRADFVSKLAIAEEEADETCYFLELIMESGLLTEAKVKPLWREADEILRILAASRKTARYTRSDRRSNIADRT